MQGVSSVIVQSSHSSVQSSLADTALFVHFYSLRVVVVVVVVDDVSNVAVVVIIVAAVVIGRG